MSDLLRQYDARLRTSAEMQGATRVTQSGPLWLGRFEGGQLFVTYQELDDPAARVRSIRQLIDSDVSILEAE